MAESSLEAQLAAIKRRLEQGDGFPATTLDIIGHPGREQYWERFLVYFLDPTQPHGFGTDVLEAFVRAIAAHSETTLSRPPADLDTVTVQSQVPTGNGPVDILLFDRGEWFVCIELKSKSPETNRQTVRYAAASRLGDLAVTEHDGIGEYVYLAPETAVTSRSDEFIDVSWRRVIDHFEPLLSESRGQYPTKSTAQFADYIDTIKQELNMGDMDSISTETQLYLEYSETIDRLVEHYESDRKKILRSITDAFLAQSECERDDWNVNTTKRYVNVYKPVWKGVGPGVTIEYEPTLHLDRSQPAIRLRLDIEHGDKEELRTRLSEQLSEDDREWLADHGWEFTDGSYSYLANSVPFDFETPQESIGSAMAELHEFRGVVEPAIDAIVADYQDT